MILSGSESARRGLRCGSREPVSRPLDMDRETLAPTGATPLTSDGREFFEEIDGLGILQIGAKTDDLMKRYQLAAAVGGSAKHLLERSD